MMTLIGRAARELSRTVVVVLHDINMASACSDRIVAIKDGRILRRRPPLLVIAGAGSGKTSGLCWDIMLLDLCYITCVITENSTGERLLHSCGDMVAEQSDRPVSIPRQCGFLQGSMLGARRRRSKG
ncbi:hypothetical protein LX76_04238 [Cereibacter changlensis]|uniref:Iron complex transport system ATP-binding protein n=1 Tax=Cereibacter changlensis TaxID=402884 RepID=A0A2W7SD79_9RHOB|nr:hypothetical protein LX76_04238 [Cereibacter changlensis]